ncbi:MAG TPA: division/cell wall cluster transcriptional repressor MraZ [Pirellulales bacterium]|nr:division/cell wall cluster transcriptional repressor MraZ [Pirellulales bacterium]
MPEANEFILGEFQRTFDERYRLAIPAELVAALGGEEQELILAKERPGCLSLWNAANWQSKLSAGVDLVQAKMRAGKLEGKLEQVQLLGRLLSSRHRNVPLAARGRLIVPEGFREFLHAEPGSNVMIIGAAVCVEIWNPQAWMSYLEARMPKFRRLFDRLSG